MLLERFLQWVEKTPDAPALVSNSESLSYRDLYARAEGIQAQLLAVGVGPKERVTLQLEKTPEAIVAILGVLLTGAAYVPIDPRAPAERVERILGDAKPKVALFGAAFLERLNAIASTCLEELECVFVLPNHSDVPLRLEGRETGARHDSRPSIPPEAAAYILYTSGSTGTPKGVEISHAAACAFVDWAAQCFSITRGDRLTSIAPLSFDLSIFDVFVTLSTGAQVTLVAQELLLRPREFVRKLGEWGITTLYAVPTTLQLLVEDGGGSALSLPNLRQILYAGEAYPVRKLALAMQSLPQAQFYNLFGPTETNVCTYYAFTEPVAADATSVPIGRACEHLRVELCDDSGQSVPPGNSGEICVSGASVMTGYFRTPAANESVFFERRDENGRMSRYYRTGDFAQIDAEGFYWFLGRRDRMVKRRGYRIELGEIEAALSRYPGLREVATYAEREGDETRIVAVVVPEPGVVVSSLSLRAHCGGTLAPYLVPDSVRIAAELPRTSTGKLDYQRLGPQNPR